MRKKIPMTGQRFGYLLVEKEAPRLGPKVRWVCRCECGKEHTVTGVLLRNGEIKSCGCKKPKIEDITGRLFGRLTPVSVVAKQGRRGAFWLCECACGSRTTVSHTKIISGHTKSCGCYNSEARAAKNYKHGQSKTKEHVVWMAMRSRCNNPHDKNYKNYGGRGITVCKRWDSYTNFINDMGQRPSGFSIERIDNSKGYSPENCTWASRRQQSLNKRTTVFVIYKGEKRPLVEVTSEADVSHLNVRRKLARGWSIERAIQASKKQAKENSNAC
jgi:hypothetical protein